MKFDDAAAARTTRARWRLEELGLEHDQVRLDLGRGEQRRAD
jgi:glutathione S-transferase